MNLEFAQSRIHHAKLHTKLLLLQRLLARLGFGDVRSMGRLKAGQKSKQGGHELFCRFQAGSQTATMVVKLVSDSARLRMLCELAGTVLLNRAQFGLLVTTKPSSGRMFRFLDRLAPLKIDLIDGPHLAQLLHKYGIGVREHGEPDFSYLEQLDGQEKEVVALLNSLSR